MQDHIVRWEAREADIPEKSPSWYWAVGIIAAGVAVASAIGGDYLFSLIAVIGGFAIMLAGSRRSTRRSFGLSERGVHVGHERIAYAAINGFAIYEDEPKRLVLATEGLMGTVSIPLGDADFRAIRTELKNRNIEEREDLDSMAEKLARSIGI